MQIEIIEAGNDLKHIVGNLLQYYIHDFTDFLGFSVPSDGRFATSCFDKYWSQEGHRAFLVKVDGELAGFLLIENEGVLPESQFSVGEFFIMRKLRRQGIGQQVACSIFDRFRSRWEVRQVIQNKPATIFWRKVIAHYTGGRFTELPEPITHGQWTDCVQVFDNTEPAAENMGQYCLGDIIHGQDPK